MTILLTGGTGLVGARLLPRLLAAGVACRALVRPGKETPAGVTPVLGDLSDPETLARAVEGVTAVVHLAALFRTQDESDIWKTNHEGTANLIAATQAHAPAARFIMASTGLVYHYGSQRPGRESDTLSATLAYPASKLAAENDLRASGLNWSILRLAFVYGDGDGHLEAAPKLFARTKWHPAQTLSMVHHRDVGVAMGLALQGVMDGRVVNITDEAPTTAYEIAQIVGDPMEPAAEPLANPWMSHMDGSLARTLGFQPTIRTVHQAVQEGAL
jgi:UDP-glucose 4-epimerase